MREGRAGPSRPPPHPVDPPPRRDEGRERGVKRPRRQWIPCLVPGCKRGADDPHAICCDQCGRTAGTLHSQRCNERARESLDPTWDDDDNYEDDDEDWDDPPPKKGKGKGKGKKGSRVKSFAKAQRDRERWRSWGTWGGTKGKARRWNAARFQAALKLGAAENTTKSVNSRLTTWDRTLRLLEEKEVIPPTDSPDKLSPQRLKAGVACLKAQGYRSAELYMSAALLRHRAKYGQEWDVGIAAQEAVRLAKRGRGPPTGKQPVPVPRAGSFLFEALVTSIWYLLRVSELFALNIEDVFQKQVAGRIQVAVMVRSSKTDQEYNGEYVTRECTCTRVTVAPPTFCGTRWLKDKPY